jgi:hypothetical protein
MIKLPNIYNLNDQSVRSTFIIHNLRDKNKTKKIIKKNQLYNFCNLED